MHFIQSLLRICVISLFTYDAVLCRRYCGFVGGVIGLSELSPAKFHEFRMVSHSLNLSIYLYTWDFFDRILM